MKHTTKSRTILYKKEFIIIYRDAPIRHWPIISQPIIRA